MVRCNVDLMPLRVLLTGFEPFHDAPRNPSGEAALALDGARVRGAASTEGRVVGRVLPVLWGTAAQQLRAHLTALRPHLVISTGMAQGTYRVERTANNAGRSIPDNAGKLPHRPSGAPAARLSTRLPVAAIEAAIAAAGGPVEPSDDAGGFICNEVFLALMRACRRAAASVRPLRAGFIHVPNDRHVPASFPQRAVNEAITAAIRATLDDLSENERRRAAGLPTRPHAAR